MNCFASGDPASIFFPRFFATSSRVIVVPSETASVFTGFPSSHRSFPGRCIRIRPGVVIGFFSDGSLRSCTNSASRLCKSFCLPIQISSGFRSSSAWSGERRASRTTRKRMRERKAGNHQSAYFRCHRPAGTAKAWGSTLPLGLHFCFNGYEAVKAREFLERHRNPSLLHFISSDHAPFAHFAVGYFFLSHVFSTSSPTSSSSDH